MSNKDADLEAYKQAFESLRHYGSLRFTVLTVYIFIAGGLFTMALRVDERATLQFVFPLVAGIVIALAFLLTELRINQILAFYAKKIEDLGEVLEMSPKAAEIPPRSRLYRATQVLTLIIYGGSILMWFIAAAVVLLGGR